MTRILDSQRYTDPDHRCQKRCRIPFHEKKSLTFRTSGVFLLLLLFTVPVLDAAKSVPTTPPPQDNDSGGGGGDDTRQCTTTGTNNSDNNNGKNNRVKRATPSTSSINQDDEEPEDNNDDDEEEDAWRIPGTPLSRTTGATEDFWEYFGCDDVFATTRPLHNESTWMLLRGAYQGVVGPQRSSIALTTKFDTTNSVNYHSGFHVPYYTGQVPRGVGRGVFSSLPIAKDTLVWTAETNSARFSTGAQFRQFLLSIPNDLACDVMIWSYCQYVDDDDDNDEEEDDEKEEEEEDISDMKLVIQCDLDDGSFVNTGDGTVYENYEEEEDGELGAANIGMPEHLIGLHKGENLYALRDIDAGEQILVNYGEFAVPEGWKEFGL